MERVFYYQSEAEVCGKMAGIITTPTDFDPTKEKLPVIVFLHGAGERGDGSLEQVELVKVNGVPLEEPYISDKSLGECDIELPYQVPEGRIFVMGDHRSISVDSRNTALGCVANEQVVGRLLCRIWPLTELEFFRK